jgi:periplasmic divalent cation tolerance protein
MENYVLIMCAAGSAENANLIASELVSRRLAACAQIFPIESFYRWENAVQHESEFMLHIKTTSERATSVESAIKSLHTYDLPEIARIEISGGSREYLAWISASVGA